MAVDITIPSPGESVTEVTIGPWHKKSGEWVEQDETLVEIESDKVTLEVPAPESGVLNIAAEEGEEKEVGDVIGNVDPSAEATVKGEAEAAESKGESKQQKQEQPAEAKTKQTKEKQPAEAEAGAPSQSATTNEIATATAAGPAPGDGARATPLARKIAQERGVDLARLSGTGPSGRITKEDVLAISDSQTVAESEEQPAEPETVPAVTGGTRGARREKMTKLRRRIAERLVEAQQTAAMLTTFNEADMTEVMRLRKAHKEDFKEHYGVSLGFMSFFVKACVSALQQFPRINAYVVDDEIEYHDYTDISIAVGTERGLVVPVLRNAEIMSFADIEQSIQDFAKRAQAGKLTIEEMTGGTFTISNGGVYGSLNSTPILNPPQSGILGMHKIMNRPMEAPDNPGQIALRPMMYLALSYDHRIVDGAEAVQFLVHVKQCIENPERMLLGL